MAAEVARAPAALAPTAGAGPAAVPAAFKTTALYVGDLNPDVNETVLYEVFNAVGSVATIRVCRNQSTRESLGYAYVNFHTQADAEKAIAELNYTPIKGRPCRIMLSQRDPSVRRNNVGNVFVKNLGPEISTKELHETFKLFGNIYSCKVASDSRGGSKGYGFVHFESEEAAKAAIAGVNGMEWNGRTVVCMPYVPKHQRSGPEWTNLFVKNVPKEWTQKMMADTFAAYGDIISAVISTDETGKSRGFGFVCFKDHGAALEAEKALNGKEYEGTPATLPPFLAKKAEGDAAVAPVPTKLKLYVGRALKKVERERLLRDALDAARRERISKWQGCNLYVRNLDESVDDATLRKEFGKFGSITSAMVQRDKEGRSKLFGYVCFAAPEEATKALTEMNRKLVAGKPLYVQLWQPKETRQAAVAQAQRAAVRTNATAAQANAATNPLAALAAMNPAVLNNPAFQAALQAARTPTGTDPAQQMQILQQFLYLAYLQTAAQNNQRMFAGAAGANGPAGRGAPAAGPMAPGARPPVVPGFPTAPGANPLLQANAQQLFAALAGAMPGAPAVNARATGRRAAGPAATGGAATAPAARAASGATVPAKGGASAAPAGAATKGGKPATPTSGARGTAAAPATAAVPAATAATMQYRTAARNVAEVPMGGEAGLMPAPVAAPASFVTQLSAADPQRRKAMIGERLYAAILAKEPTRTGKVTGMLLEAMDDAELLHLLESPAELDARVNEALDVLRAHDEPKKA